jgi:hypothetical protein
MPLPEAVQAMTPSESQCMSKMLSEPARSAVTEIREVLLLRESFGEEALCGRSGWAHNVPLRTHDAASRGIHLKVGFVCLGFRIDSAGCWDESSPRVDNPLAVCYFETDDLPMGPLGKWGTTGI